MRQARFPNRFGQLVAVRFIGYLLNTILPTGVIGDIAQVFFVVRRPRVSASHALSASFADRLVGLGGLVLILVLTLPWVSLQWPEVLWIAPLAGAGFVLGLLFLAAIARASVRGRFWFSGVINYVLVLVRRASLAKKGARLLTTTTLMSLAAQTVVSVAPWVLLQEISAVPFLFSLAVIALATLSTLAPITIGGLGIREWILFGAMGSFGVTLPEAVAVSIAWFAVTVAVIMVLSTISIVSLLLTRNSGFAGARLSKPASIAPHR